MIQRDFANLPATEELDKAEIRESLMRGMSHKWGQRMEKLAASAEVDQGLIDSQRKYIEELEEKNTGLRRQRRASPSRRTLRRTKWLKNRVHFSFAMFLAFGIALSLVMFASLIEGGWYTPAFLTILSGVLFMCAGWVRDE